MSQSWIADPNSAFLRRLGDEKSPPYETCPTVWELDNGDFVVVGTDLTAEYRSRLPEGVSIAEHERLVVIPRARLVSAKKDIPGV
ncbi:hypothetical protein [Amycolatopsis alba]|uniref:Uncharacterized protein n=1 Tax=Amycolatopsis alba DSM 44262 TaxID=1125972 RepID=A0A229RC44_AMYAL|nr:hypothetical protein [Amycolatopsis alba]OXM44031.1 hypothetical protein CFP75_35970 [Amycolatopsis alba DSM 44262]